MSSSKSQETYGNELSGQFASPHAASVLRLIRVYARNIDRNERVANKEETNLVDLATLLSVSMVIVCITDRCFQELNRAINVSKFAF